MFMRACLVSSCKIPFELALTKTEVVERKTGSVPWILGAGIRWDKIAAGPGV